MSYNKPSLETTVWRRRLEKFSKRWPALGVGTAIACALGVCAWYASQFQEKITGVATAMIVGCVGLLLAKKLWIWLTGLSVSDIIKSDVPKLVEPYLDKATTHLSQDQAVEMKVRFRDIFGIIGDLYSTASQLRTIRTVLAVALAVGGAFLMYVQIQKLTEQNRLLGTQNELFKVQNAIAVSNNHFELDLALGREDYGELRRVLNDSGSSDLALASALRQAPEIGVRPVRYLARDDSTFMAASPLQLDYRYPNYDSVRGLLREFTRGNRLGSNVTTDAERESRSEASTELVIAFHETQFESPDGAGNDTILQQLGTGKLSDDLKTRLQQLPQTEELRRQRLLKSGPPPDWKHLINDVFTPPEVVNLLGWPHDLLFRAQILYAFGLAKAKPIIILPLNCDGRDSDLTQIKGTIFTIGDEDRTSADFARSSFECSSVELFPVGPSRLVLASTRFGGSKSVVLNTMARTEAANANFDGSPYVQIITLDSNFEASSFVKTTFRGSCISTNFSSSNFIGAMFTNGEFWDCSFRGARFEGSKLFSGMFAACDFRKANFAPRIVKFRERKERIVVPRGEKHEERTWLEIAEDGEIQVLVPGAVLRSDFETPAITLDASPDSLKEVLDRLDKEGFNALPELKSASNPEFVTRYVNLWGSLMQKLPESGFLLDSSNGIPLVLPREVANASLFQNLETPSVLTRDRREQRCSFAGATFANEYGACYMTVVVRDMIRKLLDIEVHDLKSAIANPPDLGAFVEEGDPEAELENLKHWLVDAERSLEELEKVITNEDEIEAAEKAGLRSALRE